MDPNGLIKGVKQNPKRKRAESQLTSLTSLTQMEFDELLHVFAPLVEKKLAHYTLKGDFRKVPCFKERKNSSLYGSEIKLLFLLMYMKENANQAYHGFAFSMSQTKVSEWVYFLSPVLEESLKKLVEMPQTERFDATQAEEADYLLMDVTERRAPRRTDKQAQREEYSGKKKCHMIKNLAITDPRGYVLFVSDSYEGRIHDKPIGEDLSIEIPEKKMLVDLGFLGIEKSYPNVMMTYKKPKNGELTREEKKINRIISQLRIRLEHAFGGIKCLKIIRNMIRLKSSDIRDQMMRIATALHNLRFTFRKAIQNDS